MKPSKLGCALSQCQGQNSSNKQCADDYQNRPRLEHSPEDDVEVLHDGKDRKHEIVTPSLRECARVNAEALEKRLLEGHSDEIRKIQCRCAEHRRQNLPPCKSAGIWFQREFRVIQLHVF